jgi:predicted alpha/beta hydrolase
MWHALMPMITNVVGYFPGKALHLGENLPKGIALDWANRRRPEVLCDDEAERRFSATLQRYRQVTARTLALTISDDAFATPLAAQRLLSFWDRAADWLRLA